MLFINTTSDLLILQKMDNSQNAHHFAGLFLRMHPLQRILLSLALAGITFFFIPHGSGVLMESMAVWIAFAFTYLITGWIILFHRPIDSIRQSAKKDDGSKLFVSLMVLLSSFASYCMVLLLMVSHSEENTNPILFVLICISGILLSWFMVHTLYTFHYAHMYYDEAPGDKAKDAEGLEFPQKEAPDYLDFAYFAFVIGCTFQVSDVEISSRSIRRVVLVHQLISFGMNTFVVALTINLVAGLRK